MQLTSYRPRITQGPVLTISPYFIPLTLKATLVAKLRRRLFNLWEVLWLLKLPNAAALLSLTAKRTPPVSWHRLTILQENVKGRRLPDLPRRTLSFIQGTRLNSGWLCVPQKRGATPYTKLLRKDRQLYARDRSLPNRNFRNEI